MDGAAIRKGERIEVGSRTGPKRIEARPGVRARRVKALAFYLPQYHPIPENDAWWGEGFTEWTNVVRGRPWYAQHQQPLEPGELGYYDLRDPEIRARQAALAREHGIFGFCYYYYWFRGKKLLQRPLEEVLTSGEPDFPFCLCWANENWTRRWDGEDQEVLIAQRHSPQVDARFIDDVLPALLDPRYVTCDGKPVLLVYRADLLADPVATTAAWREAAVRAGLPGLHLCTVWRVENPRTLGFDAAVEFPPHHLHHASITRGVGPADGFAGEVFDYGAAVDRIVPLEDAGFPVHRGVMPSWDNTARRGRHAHIFAGSTPERYGRWLHQVAQEAADQPGEGDRFVFINAWNEWAEGATLEPSRQFGRAYLEVTRAALEGVRRNTALETAEHRLRWRIAALDRRLEETAERADQRYWDVRGAVEEHQRGLDWLRDAGERLGKTAAGQRAELDAQAAELRRLRVLVDRRRARNLWLDRTCGVAGLLLKFPFWLLTGSPGRRLHWWRQARRIHCSGHFDPDFYCERYPEVAASGVDPLYHYVRYGAAEGRRANRGDGPRAAEAAPPPAADPSPWAAPRPSRWTFHPDQLAKRAHGAEAWLFVSHDGDRAGSQIYLLEVLRSFAGLPDVELYCLLGRDGVLRPEFERFAHVADLEDSRAHHGSLSAALGAALAAFPRPPAVALCNTMDSGSIARGLDDLGIPVVSIVHELPTTIAALGEDKFRDTIAASRKTVVVSEFVKNALSERFELAADRLEVLFAGATGMWRSGSGSREAARRWICETYDLPADAVLVLGCGTVHHRKGTDLFVQVARSAVHELGLDRLRFLWVGGDESGPLFRTWCEHDIAASGLEDRVVFTGAQASTVDFYLAADAFLLTSREDPFPLVNLEAMARGVPVVAFAGAGGASEALAGGAGVLVPYLDTAAMTRALVCLIEAPRFAHEVRERALARVEERFRWDRFVGELEALLRGQAAAGTARRAAPPVT